MNAPNLDSHRSFHLLDLTALVIGYSLASLLVRAFWSSDEVPGPVVLAILGLVYGWLGMAMSGPIVLLLHHRGEPDPDDVDASEPRTWAELAWLIISFYWIGLTILVVPVRLRETRLLDTAVLGVFPILAALGLRIFGRKHLATRPSHPSWKHAAAVVLLVTWPFTWVALILLGKVLL